MAKEGCCTRFLSFFFKYVISSLIVVPLAVLFAPFYRLADKVTFEWFQTSRRLITPAAHKLRVERVQREVREWNANPNRANARMCTAKAAWNSLSNRWINKSVLTGIHVDHLNSVVVINDKVEPLSVTVEPGVMMGQLTSILLPRGWTIPLVPEFETITVGGSICGTGVESNSCRVGLSADTALEYELVLADGSLVTCSATENEDLFRAIPWSHGTLGFLTAVKFPLVPAKKYVRLEYHRAEDPTEARRLLESQDHEFVEGLAFGPRAFVVTYGDMADGRTSNPPPPRVRARVNHINRWYKPFFYQHVESFLKKRASKSQSQDGAEAPMGGATAAPCPLAVDYIPLRDYYHRHTRGYFWMAPQAVPITQSRLFLALFGWTLPMTHAKLIKRVVYAMPTKLFERAYELIVMTNLLICQDFVLPLSKLEETLQFVHKSVDVYPLWLCPTKFFRRRGLAHSDLASQEETQLYVDVGIYGQIGPQQRKAKVDYMEITSKMEQFTIERRGVQFLYADSFLSREDFRRMFDTSLYDEVRVKYGAAEAFPDVYDKVSKYARGIDKEPESSAVEV